MATVTTTGPAASGTTQAKRVSLASFRKGSTNLPPRICIHGRAGIGKTESAASAESPVFVMTPSETGLHSLMDAGRVPLTIPNIEVHSWDEYMGTIEALTTDKHSAKTLVVDVISGAEKLANVHVCNTDYAGDVSAKGFLNYQAGYRTVAMGVWKQMFAALDRLRVERQMMIVLLAHTTVANHRNPSGDDYQRWLPSFDGKYAWEATFAWCDMVLMADYEIFTHKESPDKNAKAKAKGGDRRFFHTNWNPAWDAKNRSGLPDEVEMGDSGKVAWKNLMAAIEDSKTSNGKESA